MVGREKGSNTDNDRIELFLISNLIEHSQVTNRSLQLGLPFPIQPKQLVVRGSRREISYLHGPRPQQMGLVSPL
jgi:hypothetical protein